MTFFIRLVKSADLGALFSLTKRAPLGMTSLPRDIRTLEKKICESEKSMHAGYCKSWLRQLFVLVNSVDQRIVGVSGLERESLFSPHYYLEKSPARLCLTLDSPCMFKVGSLLLDSDYRGFGLGRLLSLGRFLYLADLYGDIGGCVQAELRGWQAKDGTCTFWSSVGRAIYGGELARMDMIRGINYSLFVEKYVRIHDIPLEFLTDEVLQSLGKIHVDAMGAARMLYAQGFQPSGYIDMLDGGPVLKAEVSGIKAIRNSFRVSAKNGHQRSSGSSIWIVSNHSIQNYRACLAVGILHDDWLHLEDGTLDILGINEGDNVRAFSVE